MGRSRKPVSRHAVLPGRVLRVCVLLPVLLAAACAGTVPGRQAEPESRPAAEPDAVVAALMAAEFAWQDGRRESAARHYARAAALSDDPIVAERAAQVALIAGDAVLVRQGLERWRALDPGARAIRQVEAGLALLERDPDRAIAHLDALLAGGDEDGRTLAGQALLAAPDRDDALALVEALRVRDPVPGGVEALVLLGQVAQQLNDVELAERCADQAVQRFPDAAAGWSFKGRLALARGDAIGARGAFLRALAASPDDKALRLTHAAVLHRLGETAGAARTLSEVAPDDEVLSARAAYAVAADDREQIRATYEALVALPTPRPPERLLLLGQMAELSGQPEAALEWYRQVPPGSQHVDATFRIAVIHEQAQRVDEAQRVLRELREGGIADDDRLAESWLLEAEMAARRGAADRAEATYRAGLSDLPDHPRILYALGLLLTQQDRIDEALSVFARLVELDPGNADALNALGYTMTDRTDRHEEALGYIERALALKPDSAAIIDSMGWVLHRLGRPSEALPHLERAFGLEPNAEIGAHLGEVLWTLGRREEARAVWKRSREIEPDNAVLRETMQRLDPGR
jgi:tetratricopeptide (TPR) repeat protein